MLIEESEDDLSKRGLGWFSGRISFDCSHAVIAAFDKYEIRRHAHPFQGRRQIFRFHNRHEFILITMHNEKRGGIGIGTGQRTGLPPYFRLLLEYAAEKFDQNGCLVIGGCAAESADTDAFDLLTLRGR